MQVGDSKVALNGLEMKILKYYDCHHIDVIFEDGTIVKNVSGSNFKRGCIKHPDINLNNRNARRKHIGEKNTNSQGYEMTIVEYRCSTDITVEFEDGFRRSGVQYSNFKAGMVERAIRSRDN